MSEFAPINANFTDGSLFRISIPIPSNDTGAVRQGLKALAESGVLNLLLLYVLRCGKARILKRATQLLYPINWIATTLAAVENSSDNFQSAKKSDDPHDEVVEHELAAQQAYAQATVGQQNPNNEHVPITSSIRRTLRYLYYLAGPFSLWRGIYFSVPLMVVNPFCTQISVFVLTRLGIDPSSVYCQPLLAIAIAILCIPIDLTWTHHVISQRTQSVSRRGTGPATARGSMLTLLRRHTSVPRFPGWAAVRHMVVPTLLATYLGQLHRIYSQSLPTTFLLQPIPEADKLTTSTSTTTTAEGLASLLELTYSATVETLTFPLAGLAATLLTRVQASLLPSEIPTVVPMDRHFGLLKSNPARRRQHSGGAAGITIWEAWETLTWSDSWRIAKVLAKAVAIAGAVGIAQGLFLVVVVEELTPGFELGDASTGI